jgi:hypothetical protein
VGQVRTGAHGSCHEVRLACRQPHCTVKFSGLRTDTPSLPCAAEHLTHLDIHARLASTRADFRADAPGAGIDAFKYFSQFQMTFGSLYTPERVCLVAKARSFGTVNYTSFWLLRHFCLGPTAFLISRCGINREA